MVSAALLPLNSMVSVPAWPSTTSLPSPGSQMNTSSPVPRNATSLPRPPSIVSLPAPPVSTSLPPPPSMVSLPAPPSMTSAASDGRVPPVAVTVDETKSGVMISSAFVPVKLAMVLILNHCCGARMRRLRSLILK